MWTLSDGYNRNVKLWAVVFTFSGRISMESNDERWPHGIHSSLHGRPSELVLLDLEGLLDSPTVPRRTIADERLE